MSDPEIAQDFSPILKIYKDGRVERLVGTSTVPPSHDQRTGVRSKDVLISLESTIFARVYIPSTKTAITVTTADPQSKGHRLPVLVYFHGGCFCIESAASPVYHDYLNSLVSKANVVALSVDYRTVPEHPLPAAYNDSWDALRWLSSHCDGTGPDEWINAYADLKRVFLAGDSAGANIAHHMGLRLGQALKFNPSERLEGLNLRGIILVHSFFLGSEPIGAEKINHTTRSLLVRLWHLACPTTSGCDDPLINPAKDSRLSSIGCDRILIFAAEKEMLRERGWAYRESLTESGWSGHVEVVEAEGEDHQFHLMNPDCNAAVTMMKRFVSFLKEEEGDGVSGP